MHSYDKTRPCPDCGDLDGCHVPGKVKRRDPNSTHVEGVTSAGYGQSYPLVVCLCGSTRFKDEFIAANMRETMEGNIVLSVGWFTHSGEWDALPEDAKAAAKTMLDELHKRKIDHADEILVLNLGGYIGSSTRGEIEYAKRTGKKVRYLEPVGGQ